MRRGSMILAVLALVATGLAPGLADTETSAAKKSPLGGASGVSVSSHLVEALVLAEAGVDPAAIDAQLGVVPFGGGLVEVELRFDFLDAAAVAAAEAAGLVVTSTHFDVGFLAGRIDPLSLPALTSIRGLATVHPLYGPYSNTGSVDNQADASMRADVARASFGVDGSGVEVGIVSDSFDEAGTGTVTGEGCDRLISGTASQLSGDVPTSVRLVADLAGERDEGRAMAELIADLAPGAAMSFHTAGLTEADMAAGIRALADCGADVIVDDINYYTEPMFQDGPIAQAAQDVVDGGVPFFSSAGNQADHGIDDMYVDISGASGGPGEDFHDFGGDDAFAAITLDPGEGVLVVLQWAEPFAGTLGPGAVSDYDLHLFDAPDPMSNILVESTSYQGCSMGPDPLGDPFEVLRYDNLSGVQEVVYLAVDRYCPGMGGSDHIRINTIRSGAPEFEEDIFTDTTHFGHAVAQDVMSVGAVFYGEIDDPTVMPPDGRINVEPSSALGGDVPIYFDRNGDPLPGGPVTRFKPELVSADGTNTTFFGNDIIYDPDTHPNFFGTSAAAPHAAAVAALLLESQPGFTPQQVYNQLMSTAVDVESPGVDPWSGYGLVDAVNALNLTCDGKAATIVGGPGDDVIDGTPGADVIMSFNGNDIVNGKGGNDTICLGAGDDVANGGLGADAIFGEAGADTLGGDKGNDALFGGDDNDLLVGAVGADLLVGGDGDDTLEGGAGKDTLRGEAGVDLLRGGGGDDLLRGGAGTDTLQGQGGSDTLKGEAGADDLAGGIHGDVLLGGLGNDTMSGGKGDDTANGAGGKDTISGDAGADMLSGGGKADTIRGGGGPDVIRGQGGNDTLIGGPGVDTVAGGPGTDACTGETTSGCEI